MIRDEQLRCGPQRRSGPHRRDQRRCPSLQGRLNRSTRESACSVEITSTAQTHAHAELFARLLCFENIRPRGAHYLLGLVHFMYIEPTRRTS
jgi:hypothetical protein